MSLCAHVQQNPKSAVTVSTGAHATNCLRYSRLLIQDTVHSQNWSYLTVLTSLLMRYAQRMILYKFSCTIKLLLDSYDEMVPPLILILEKSLYNILSSIINQGQFVGLKVSCTECHWHFRLSRVQSITEISWSLFCEDYGDEISLYGENTYTDRK